MTFASTSIRQYVDHFTLPDNGSSGIPATLQKSYWNLPSGTSRNVTVFLNSFYRVPQTYLELP